MLTVIINIVLFPLRLSSMKSALKMQKLQPEMKRLQNQYRSDRQKLNEEMMKLYQEHKVNPLASCFPLLLQMPVFIIMFRVLHGLTHTSAGATGFTPQYLDSSTKLYFGLGVEYALQKNFKVTAGADFTNAEFQGDSGSVRLLSIGAQYDF